jgi:hypothetical protein
LGCGGKNRAWERERRAYSLNNEGAERPQKSCHFSTPSISPMLGLDTAN